MNYFENMQREKELLERMIEKRTREISKLPSGELQIYRCGENGKYSKWYQVNKVVDENNTLTRQRKYLSKNDERTAVLLAKRGMLEAELKDLKKELRAVNMYLRNCSDYSSADKYVERNPGYENLLQPHLKTLSDYTEEELEWMNNRLPGVARNQEERIYRTKAGIMVRSKGEVIIISNLVDRRIPFKYEEKLEIPGEKYPLWPDLKILQPRTHELFIWEHFGMMERMSYSNHTSSKLDQYRRAGFVPGRNMIMTFEDDKNFIDEQFIVQLIEYYFG